MTRRARLLVVVAAACILAAPPAAAAQPAERVLRVGYLSPFSAFDPQVQHSLDILRQAFRELGHVEGQGFAIERRWADGKYERLPRLAAELVQAKVDVIITVGGLPSAQAAQKATRTIPLVVTGTVDPVEAGLIASLARPGGNITGPTIIAEALVAKQLELLTEVVPKVSRVAVLWNSSNPGNARQLRAAEAAVPGLRVRLAARPIRLQPVGVRDSGELDKAFGAMTRQRADALLVLVDAILMAEREKIAALAVRHHLPAVFGFRTHAEAGGLLAYGANRVELIRQAAVYASKILKGAKPADLPVEQPTKFELLINLKTAQALGLKIPQSVLLRADEIIEK